MKPISLRRLLRDVSSGKTSVDEATRQLGRLPFETLLPGGRSKTPPEVRYDHHRHLRTGIPEVVFGEGKKASTIEAIVERVSSRGEGLLVTRVDGAVAEKLIARHPGLVHHSAARCLVLGTGRRTSQRGGIAILSAGTTDIPVAEEAAVTAEFLGHRVVRRYDVGVAGLHRLLSILPEISGCRVIVAVAGMEGALPSVLAGLVELPIVAVPTSIGYGASFRGLASLLAMMNSCAPGVSVVNIDNGFGAAAMAAKIDRIVRKAPRSSPPKNRL